MSLWTKFRDTIVGGAKIAIGTALGGPIGGLVAGSIGGRSSKPSFPTFPTPGIGTPPIMGQNLLGGAIGPVIRAGGAILRNPTVRTAATAAAGAVLGDLVIDDSGRAVGMRRKRRRMNPCNPKALNRAVRRLSMYHKQNKKIEAQLRKLAPRPRRRASAPSHHHHSH